MKHNLFQTIFIFFEKRKWLVIFLFCFAVIFGPAFCIFSEYSYDLIANPDIDTYINLAKFDFDQSPVRRYRIIIPFIAAGIHFILEPIFSLLEPWTFPGPGFSLCMSFFVVNSILMSIFGMIIYYLIKAYNVSDAAAIVGVLSVLTCRWTAYFAGLPMVESLYLCIIGLMLLGLKTKNTKLIILCIFLGPWAKESFVFFVPLILIYAPIKLWKQIALFAFSGIIIFSFRYAFDYFNQIEITESLGKDFDHVNLIIPSLKRLFSFHGIYEIFSVFGIWGMLFLLLANGEIRKKLQSKLSKSILLFLVIIFIHAILSTDLARMFYLASPVIALLIALVINAFDFNNGKITIAKN